MVLLLLLSLPLSAQEIGTVTLLEGPLRIIRGTTILRAAEGERLRRGDIVESSAAGFVQMELLGGAIVALGPATQVFFFNRAGSTTELVVLGGWLKGEINPNAGTYRCASPQLAATTREGAVLLHTSGEGANIFIESGSAGISSVSPEGHLANPGAAKAGQFFSRRAGQGIASASRPSSAFLEAMPRQFRDTLPSRLARFAGKAAEPARDHEVSYSEIQPWLTMGRAWRRGFVERFEPRLRDPEFRRAVDAHMSEHPEWDPILHPEKYQAKTPPEAAEHANSQPGR